MRLKNRITLRWLACLEAISARLREKDRLTPLQDSNNQVGTERYFLMWRDEYVHPLTLEILDGHPWWFPFNAFLHRWLRSDTGLPHSHPRWTITIVLAGELWEIVDRKRLRILKPGCIVFRRPSTAHLLLVPAQYIGRTWTLFIVGRRRYAQEFLQADGTRVNAARYIADRKHSHYFETGYGGETGLPLMDVEPECDGEYRIQRWLAEREAISDEIQKQHQEA